MSIFYNHQRLLRPAGKVWKISLGSSPYCTIAENCYVIVQWGLDVRLMGDWECIRYSDA